MAHFASQNRLFREGLRYAPLLKKKTTLMRSYAESTFLPFSLRLLKTVLPFAVLILFLKPCTLLLCLLLG